LTEQADDAAALLREVELAPAVAYGSSSGAVYVTDLLVRHPDVLTAAVLHEPPFIAVTTDPAGVGAALDTLITESMARGGPPEAMAAFLRQMVGEVAYASFDAELIARCTGNGDVFFGLEMPALQPYLPSRAHLSEVGVPCVVAAGEENASPESSLHWLYEASAWLAEGLSVELTQSPGGHAPQASHPEAFVDWLRPVLRCLTVPAGS
jgi:pimeloyl-ACP methyl ester carboxylesterase